ncbi:MAG: tetratricopeptide repeat protein [Desulfobacterales bacterium]|nr:tetratricopeptide repeat protein [Desulfobacteraceae bacterium]MDH3575130.1 tetratricopeptide repeat protein [Desulfobacteraceae bacterium]MDH3826176.1 tetratricopeptide repeat protein [Desulfobacterales bacterium]
MKKMAICIFILVWPLMGKAQGLDAMAYFNLGIENRMTYKKINYFSRALDLNPSLAEAYEKRGMLYYFQEKYELMIHDFQRFIEFVPTKASALRMLGIGYLKTGLYAEAISCFTIAIELEPKFAGAYSNRAEAYRFVGKYDQSIRDSTTAIRIGGDPLTLSESYRNRYKIYWKLGQADKAYEELRNAWRLDPRVWQIWRKDLENFYCLENTRKFGLVYIIGIAAVLIFKLKLKPPGKDD